MAAVREVETKYAVHGLFALPDLAQAHEQVADVREEAPLRLCATYYDAPDLRLAREGITLRHRVGEGAPRWTLKLPRTGSGSGLDRDEVSVEAAAEQVPAELRELLTVWLRGERVDPVAVLETERETRVLVDEEGRPAVEVVDDTVSLLDGGRIASRFREVEVELRDSPLAGPVAASLGRALLRSGASAADQSPKLVRALGPRALQPSTLPPAEAVHRKDPAGDLVVLALRTGLARLVGADLGVRRFEPDAVHQMRVACRRLRSDLRTFGPLLADERTEPLRTELAWLADSLGATRDLEVLRARLHRTAAADPLAPLDDEGLRRVDELLAEQEEQARPVVLAALRSERYVALLAILVETAERPALTALAQRRTADVLPELVGASWKHLAKRAGRLHEDDPDDDWHKARILAKRARYAAEAAAVAVGGPARRTAKAATAVQELLGEHQDAAVAADRVLALALEHPGDPVLALTCGRLAERERATVHRTRAGFPDVWDTATQGRSTAWLG